MEAELIYFFAGALAAAATFAIYRRSRMAKRRRQTSRRAMRYDAYGPDELLLPDEKADLSDYRDAATPEPAFPTPEMGRLELRAHFERLKSEFKGRSALLHLHACCVSRLRRKRMRPPPRNAMRLFERMWDEERDFLLSGLSLRWLGSAAATFADRAALLEDRYAGMLAVTLLDMVKLQETERRFAGLREERFELSVKFMEDGPFFDGVEPYSIQHGDLIDHMDRRIETLSQMDGAPQAILAEIWRRLGREDTVIRRLIEARGDAGGGPKITMTG